MSSALILPFQNCRQPRGSEAQSGDFLPVELAGGGAQGHAESSPAPFSTEGLDLLLLQATRTAAIERAVKG